MIRIRRIPKVIANVKVTGHDKEITSVNKDLKNI